MENDTVPIVEKKHMTNKSTERVAFGRSVCFEEAKCLTEVSLTANFWLLSQSTSQKTRRTQQLDVSSGCKLKWESPV